MMSVEMWDSTSKDEQKGELDNNAFYKKASQIWPNSCFTCTAVLTMVCGSSYVIHVIHKMVILLHMWLHNSTLAPLMHVRRVYKNIPL